ncbi:MAG: photosynthetic reaction center subunit L, partial [Chloroflexi bacterium]
MLSFEAKYRQEAMAVPPRASFGLLKIWIGRFYLGFWGVVALVFG